MAETSSLSGGKILTQGSSDASTNELLDRDSIESLRDSGRLLETAFAENPLPTIISTLDDSVIVDVNRAFLTYLEKSREQVVGASSFDVGLWPDVKPRRKLIEELEREGAVRRFPFTWKTPSGKRIDFLLSCNLIDVRGRTCLVTAAEDVTELETAQRELARSEARFRAALDGSLDAFFLLEAIRDEAGQVVDFELATLNPGATELTGVAGHAELGSRLLERCPIHRELELFERYRNALESGRASEGEFEFVDAKGRRRWMRQQLVPLESGVAIWAREVTELHHAEEERKRLEADFHRGQRLESLGLLAGGVAHDFNNLLTGILGYAEMAVRRLPRGSSAAKPLRELRDAAERAAELTHKMLAFAGGGALEVEWVSLNEIVEEMVDLARPSLPVGRAVKLELARPAPGFEADATQMRQVVINLILNASEAIEAEGGTITVATGEISCERERLTVAVLGADAPEGRYAFLSVSDDGVGIAPDMLDRVFEPFFTTKFTGRGLGLAAVLGIVRAHRGVIELDTEPGRGTRIMVLLPISRPRA